MPGQLSEFLRHGIPIDHVPPRGHVVRTLVLVLQVVRVLPDVESEQRLLTFHQRIVLIRRARDRELAVALVDQPRPARPESTRRRGGELLLELREVAEGALDRIAKASARLTAAL